MKTPAFTAEASLYQSRNRYGTSASAGDGPDSGSVVPSYFPGPQGQRDCQTCLKGVAIGFASCTGLAGVSCGLGCIGTLIGYPICFAACFGPAYALCVGSAALAGGTCLLTACCPKRCGPPDAGDLAGSGCCDEDETCVDEDDPNSRHGCCPSDRAVCHGKCCAKDESCCGDTCCPRGYYCLDGVCSEYPVAGPPFAPVKPPAKGAFPFERPEPQELLGEDAWRGIPRQGACPPGWKPCYDVCCGPGLTCCNGVCRTICIS
jgi:hypothetical protein